MEVASEPGASSWFSAIPIQEYGFALHKGDFCDALCLRYGWQPCLLPSSCVCGQSFTVEHAMNCHCGGFLQFVTMSCAISQHHYSLRYAMQPCPCLQPLSGEQPNYKTANDADEARLDVVAENVWSKNRQKAFFDVKVFNPFSRSNVNIPLTQCHRRLEQDKRRSYEHRVREVEHGCFSPLVFSTLGGLSPTATIVYKRIASLIAEKNDQPYSRTFFWLRCRLRFSLLRSAIVCLRGSQSSYHRPIFYRAQLTSCARLAAKPPHHKFLSFVLLSVLSLYVYLILVLLF